MQGSQRGGVEEPPEIISISDSDDEEPLISQPAPALTKVGVCPTSASFTSSQITAYMWRRLSGSALIVTPYGCTSAKLESTVYYKPRYILSSDGVLMFFRSFEHLKGTSV